MSDLFYVQIIQRWWCTEEIYYFYSTQVTWVEHAEYDESQIHELYRPLISSSLGFGAQRWVATLQRQCQCLASLMSSSVPSSSDQAGNSFFQALQ